MLARHTASTTSLTWQSVHGRLRLLSFSSVPQLSKLKDGHLILTSELAAVATGFLCTSAVGRSVRLQETTRHLMTAGCLLAGV